VKEVRIEIYLVTLESPGDLFAFTGSDDASVAMCITWKCSCDIPAGEHPGMTERA